MKRKYIVAPKLSESLVIAGIALPKNSPVHYKEIIAVASKKIPLNDQLVSEIAKKCCVSKHTVWMAYYRLMKRYATAFPPPLGKKHGGKRMPFRLMAPLYQDVLLLAGWGIYVDKVIAYELAEKHKISKSAVYMASIRLRKTHPELFPKPEDFEHKRRII